MRIGDIVKFVDQSGGFRDMNGDIALVVEQDNWATIVEWVQDGVRDDIAYYADHCPFTEAEAWWKIISYAQRRR